MNSLENMGYRVITSGAFTGGQGVFDRYIGKRALLAKEKLQIYEINYSCWLADSARGSSFGPCTEPHQSWSVSRKEGRKKRYACTG